MTTEQVKNLKLGITPINSALCLTVESAIEWIHKNTSLKFKLDSDEIELPASVKLFIIKFTELMTATEGVASESISGLSQSFKTTDKDSILWDLASSLLGEDVLNSRVTFFSASQRWDDCRYEH